MTLPETLTTTPTAADLSVDSLFSSSLLHWISTAFLAYIAVLWIALILWVTKDITNRTNNILFQILCISLVIFLTPVFGLVVYLLVRPGRTLSDHYYEEMETELFHSEDPFSCSHCHSKVDMSFIYCPNCGEKNKAPCISCKKEIPGSWHCCAHCGTVQKQIESGKQKKTEEKPKQDPIQTESL